MSIDAPVFTPPTDQPQNTTAPAASLPKSCTFSWEEPPTPPARGRGGSAVNVQLEWFRTEVLPQLRQNPGRYAKVFAYDKRNSAAGRVARLRQQHPGIQFMSRASGMVDGQLEQPEWSAVYAAWIDGGDAEEQPQQ